MNLGESVKLLRFYRGQQQKAFADYVGITVSYLSEIERGTKRPSIDVLEAIAYKCGVPLSGLVQLAEEVEQVDTHHDSLAMLLKLYERVENGT